VRRPPAARKYSTVRRPINRQWPRHRDFGTTSSEQWVAEQELSFQVSGNPIYVWLALSFLDFRRWNAAADGDKWVIGDPLPPLVLPEWCARHLINVALEIETLSRGRDPRQRPPFTPNQRPYHKSVTDWSTKPTLDAKKALSRLPSQLAFTKRGWNAFDDFWRTERKRLAADYRDHLLRNKDMSAGQANDQVQKAFNIEDERTLRGWMADARRHRPGKP
jgi:hypothetical protein